MRRPPLGAGLLVQAVPADIGASAATVGHHVFGGQPDPAQPAELHGTRPGRGIGQALLIRHGSLPFQDGRPLTGKTGKRLRADPGVRLAEYTPRWQSRTSRTPAHVMWEGPPGPPSLPDARAGPWSDGTHRLRGPELRLLRHPDRLGDGPDCRARPVGSPARAEPWRRGTAERVCGSRGSRRGWP